MSYGKGLFFGSHLGSTRVRPEPGLGHGNHVFLQLCRDPSGLTPCNGHVQVLLQNRFFPINAYKHVVKHKHAFSWLALGRMYEKPLLNRSSLPIWYRFPSQSIIKKLSSTNTSPCCSILENVITFTLAEWLCSP